MSADNSTGGSPVHAESAAVETSDRGSLTLDAFAADAYGADSYGSDAVADEVPRSAYWSNLLADRWRVARLAGMAVYAVLFYWQYTRGMPWASKGLPLEREQFIGWMALGACIWSLGRDRKELFLALGGFGALACCFVIYDFSRGAIDNLWGSAVLIPNTTVTTPSQAVLNARRIITAERAIFFGKMPNEWLQDSFYLPSNQHPPKWEVVTALTYTSHFATVYVVALFMWFRNRRIWLQWVRSLVTLITLGVMGYLAFPTAPPWMAAKFDLMPVTARPGTRALQYIHLQFADRLWNKGQALTNLVAAMPSLHMGFSVLVTAFFWRTSRRWLRVVLVLYPLSMLFTLVYGGEHYIMDCLAGALLAWFAVWLNRRYVAWRSGEPFLPGFASIGGRRSFAKTQTAGEFPEELPAVATTDSVEDQFSS